MSKKRSVTSRDPLGLQAVGLFEAAYKQADLDNARARRLLRRGGELTNGLTKLVADLAMSTRYADEEVNSDCLYSEKYRGPRTIEEQILALAKIFNLDPSRALELAKNLPELPDGAEGWFAVLDWEDLTLTYCKVVKKVFDAVSAQRNFYSHCLDKLGPEYLRPHARTVRMLRKIRAWQNLPSGGGILIVPAQLGLRHRGRSVRRARAVFARREFGLGAVAVGSILLTHSELETRWEHLHINCAGDEYTPGDGGGWQLTPFFHFASSLKFGANWYNHVHQRYGSATGFVVLANKKGGKKF